MMPVNTIETLFTYNCSFAQQNLQKGLSEWYYW